MNREWQERDARAVWHPFEWPVADPPIPIARAAGSYIYDTEGTSYLDAISSWWVNVHGHAHEHITSSLQKCLKELHHVMFAGFTHEAAITLAERLLEKLPGNPARIFFSDNGSTAVEVALKIAIQYWFNRGERRTIFVALESGYHGDTFGAMSVSARGLFVEPFTDLLFSVEYIRVDALDHLQQILETGRVAAFIYEPLVQAAGGMKVSDQSDLHAILLLCRRHGVPIIADEVFTGFGRTGTFFASAQIPSVSPDLMCLSKGLTGGTLALGATSCSHEIYSTFNGRKPLLHGHSYTANPLACTAALASLDLFERPECGSNIDQIAASQREFLKILELQPGVKNPRCCGTILAFEVRTSDGDAYTNPLRARLYRAALERGVLLRPLGNTIYSVPPYCITREELSKVQSTMVMLSRL